MRKRYQAGTITREKRVSGPDVWLFRYRDGEGKNRKQTIGTSKEYPSRAAASKAAEVLRVKVNQNRRSVVFFGELIERYKLDALPRRASTAGPYLSMLKRISGKWGETRITEMSVLSIENWLSGLPLSKKTLSNIKAMMHRVWQCGLRWELISGGNPLALVELRNIRRPSPRQRTVLTVDQFARIAADDRLPLNVKTMVHLAGRLGLRASEFLGLRWEDIDLEHGLLQVRRSYALRGEDDPKTPESAALLPLPAVLVGILEEWKAAQPDIDGWVFGSPITGRPLSRENLLVRYLAPVCRAHGAPGAGWHSLRHTFRSVARDAELEPEDQKELMRHTDLRMTQSYGRESQQRMRRLREASERVSELLDGKPAVRLAPKVTLKSKRA